MTRPGRAPARTAGHASGAAATFRRPAELASATRTQDLATRACLPSAVLLDAGLPLGGPEGQQIAFVYQGFRREIVFGDPAGDLLELYEAERKAVGGRYTHNRRRHYAPVFGGDRRMDKETDQAVEAALRRGPDEIVDYEGAERGLLATGWIASSPARAPRGAITRQRP